MKSRFAQSQLYAFSTVFLWSTAYVFTKLALLSFSPSVLGLLRCLVGTACLMLVVGAKGLAWPERKALPGFIFSGAVGFALYLIVFNTGSALLNATTSCIIISTSPLITALLAVFVFRERMGAFRWLTILLAFSGVVIMCLWDGEFAISEGLLWMLGAAFLISSYNIAQRWLGRRYAPLQITAYSFFFGTVLLLGFLPKALEQVPAAPWPQIGLVCFLGVFPSALAYLFWSKALALAPKTSQVTNYMFVTPFLALGLEYIVMGALPGSGTFVGGAVVLLGLALFFAAGKRECAA